MPRPRRRRRRGGRAVDRIERAGHTLWSLCVRALIAPVAFALGHAWAWVRSLSGPGKLVLLAGAAAAAVLAARALERPGGGDGDAVHVVDDTEALARVIRSEIGIGTAQQQVHIAWATRNLAAERGESIAEMACSPCGPQGRGRPVSSRQAATDADRELARLVLASPERLDPTGGASHFVNPVLQDELARRKVPGYANRPYRYIRRVWIDSYGWEPYYRLGDDLEMWGPRRRGR